MNIYLGDEHRVSEMERGRSVEAILPASHDESPRIGEILRFARGRLAPYKRIRRLEFAELPKTISGKIRRVELRRHEDEMRKQGERGVMEFWEEDFPELKVSA